MNNLQGFRVLMLGCFAVAAVPASAGGLLGGSVGSVAGSVTSSVGGAAGLGASGGPLGGLGGGLGGSATGSGILGATISSNGLSPGTGAHLTRPLHGATGKLRGTTERPWGTFEDAKGLVKSKALSASDRAVGFAPSGTLTGTGPLSANASGSGQAQGSAKGSGLRRSLNGMVLSRNVTLPDVSARRQASAKGKASASGSAEMRRAKVASSGGGSASVAASH